MGMDLYDALLTTRAMRRYTDEPVTDAEVLHCLRAAQQAPSGGNIQPWQFVVVTDAAVRAAVAAIYRRAYDRYEPARRAVTPPPRSPEDAERSGRMERAARYLADHLDEAPVLVAVVTPRIDMTLHDADGPLDIGPLTASVYPAVQNLMLAARGLGIGTALTTVFRVYHDEVRAALGVPDRYEVAAIVPMGRPRGRFGVAPRRPVEQVTHWNRFGERRLPS
jgi:nitroreductase